MFLALDTASVSIAFSPVIALDIALIASPNLCACSPNFPRFLFSVNKLRIAPGSFGKLSFNADSKLPAFTAFCVAFTSIAFSPVIAFDMALRALPNASACLPNSPRSLLNTNFSRISPGCGGMSLANADNILPAFVTPLTAFVSIAFSPDTTLDIALIALPNVSTCLPNSPRFWLNTNFLRISPG